MMSHHGVKLVIVRNDKNDLCKVQSKIERIEHRMWIDVTSGSGIRGWIEENFKFILYRYEMCYGKIV